MTTAIYWEESASYSVRVNVEVQTQRRFDTPPRAYIFLHRSDGVCHNLRHLGDNAVFVRQIDDVVLRDRNEFAVGSLRQRDEEHAVGRRDRNDHLHGAVHMFY